MAIYKNANLDISVAAEQNPNYNAKPSVQFSTQDKNTAKYTFTVKQNNKPVDLTGVTASVTLFSEDKSVFQSDANITNATEGKIEYVIPADAIRHHGKTRGDLRLTYPNGDVLGGLRFSFNIEQALIDRAAGTVGGVYIRDFETLKAEIQETVDSIKGLDVVRIDTKLNELEQRVEEGGVGVDEQARQEIQEVSALLADTSNYFYVPTKFPAIDGTGEINAQTVKSADIYRLYDGLMNANKDYITKKLISKDMSNTLDIYEYVFEPKNYKNTLVIGANIHGPGDTGDPKDVGVAVYYFMKDLCENWAKNDKLSFLRWNTRIVVIPIWNPWGFDNNSRYNKNNIDVNRNFDYLFDSVVDNTKGSVPFSEVESRNVRDILTKYSDAVAYLDCHCWANTDRPFQYIMNHTPLYPSNLYNKMNDLTDHLVSKYKSIKNVVLYDPSPSSRLYVENVLNIPCVTMEFVVYPTDKPIRSSEAITQMVEWYGGMAYLCAIDDNPRTIQSLRNESNDINLNMAKENNTFVITTKNTDALSFNFFNPSNKEHIVTRLNLNYLHDCEVVFPNNVIWREGSVPSFAERNHYILEFESFDFGSTWFGSVQGMWVAQNALLKDDFNRADTTNGLGKATTGQSWTKLNGDAFVIKDKKAKAGSLVTKIARTVIDCGESNVRIKLDIAFESYAAVLFRCQDDANRYTLVMNAASGVYINRTKNETTTKIVEKADYPLAAGTTYAVRIELNNNNIAVFINGESVLTTTSSDFSTATKLGLSQNNETVTTYDNLIVEPIE